MRLPATVASPKILREDQDDLREELAEATAQTAMLRVPETLENGLCREDSSGPQRTVPIQIPVWPGPVPSWPVFVIP